MVLESTVIREERLRFLRCVLVRKMTGDMTAFRDEMTGVLPGGTRVSQRVVPCLSALLGCLEYTYVY